MEKELKRLEALNDIQLMSIFAIIDKDPAPDEIKRAIILKINDILNDRLERTRLDGGY